MATFDDRVAIRTIGLTKVFLLRGLIPGRPRARVTALDAVDLEVPGGSIHGLVGPNGSGKSTLLRVLATLLLPNAGHALLGGRDVTASPVWARRHLGFSTGEERSFYWRLTGRENLSFYGDLHHLPDCSKQIKVTLDEFDLAGVADRSVSTYSQGMLRRLGLARALLHDPPVLLLDEPARSLDLDSRNHLHDILRRLRDQRGTAVLLATHDRDEVRELCDTVTALADGRVTRA